MSSLSGLLSSLPAALVCSTLVFSSGCAPSFNQLVGQSGGLEEDEPERRDPREQELNRQALQVLVERSRAEELAENASPDPLAALPVVVALPPSAITPEGELSQRALMDLLAAGPHAILGLTEWTPARQQDRAFGLTLGTPNYGQDIVARIGLRTGDVIRQVNGESVLIPDAFMRAWDGLNTADVIEIVYIRDGETRTITLPIEPPAEPSAHAERMP
jgi:hypothetical protein